MQLTLLKPRRRFVGVALISALTFAGVVPAHSAEVAVTNPTSTSLAKMPSAAVVETLTAAITGITEVGETLTAQTNASEGSSIEWFRNGTAISAAANACT